MNTRSIAILACQLLGAVTVFAVMDDATLEKWLSDNFTAPESMPWEQIDGFKEQYAVTDEQLYRVLMEIYREAEGKSSSLAPGTPEWHKNRRTIEGAISWLPKCGSIPVKELLMEYAESRQNDSWLRSLALLAYLRAADAEEAKGVLIRFLIEGDRMDSQARSTIIWSTLMVYQDAALEKRKAIVESLQAALASEDTKWLFRVYDDVLRQISPQYTRSEQRRAMLARLIRAPALCKADEYVLPELEDKLRELKRANLYTTINTNLSVVKERDFNLPLSEEERTAFETPPNVPDIDDATPKNPVEMGREVFCAFAAGAGLLIAAARWFGLRRKRGSA